MIGQNAMSSPKGGIHPTGPCQRQAMRGFALFSRTAEIIIAQPPPRLTQSPEFTLIQRLQPEPLRWRWRRTIKRSVRYSILRPCSAVKHVCIWMSAHPPPPLSCPVPAVKLSLRAASPFTHGDQPDTIPRSKRIRERQEDVIRRGVENLRSQFPHLRIHSL